MTGGDIAGLALIAVAGVLASAYLAPVKALQRFDYPQWGFVSNLVGLVAVPWLVAVLACPDSMSALAEVPPRLLLMANLLSAAWGVAAVLAGLCLVRIGFSLTVGVFTGVGLPIGVILPLVLLPTSARLVPIAVGIAVILVALGFVVAAGFGRDRQLGRRVGAGFAAGLAMAVGAGVLQVGLSFAFVFSQDAVIASLRAHGAGPLAASAGVWPVTLAGGALVILTYTGLLIAKGPGWRSLVASPRDLLLSALVGALFSLFLFAFGAGMLLMGTIGASIGFGISQTLQVCTAQVIGFASGEWRGIAAPIRRSMLAGVALLLAGVVLLAAGKAG